MLPLVLRAETDFWNSKPPEEWSDEEKLRLASASPWAISTKVKMLGLSAGPAPGMMDASSRLPPRQVGGNGGIPPVADPTALPRKQADGPFNSSGPIAFYGSVIVSWESAEPIRRLRREPLPTEFEDHWALRVTGLPPETFMPETEARPTVIRLVTGATLQITPGPPARQADSVLRLPEKRSLIFAFSRTEVTLTQSSRFASFSMNLNQMLIKVRFDLRAMNFRGAVAV